MKLVYVHLGNAKAPWVYGGIKRHKQLFPEIDIALISDSPKVLSKAKNLDCEIFRYTSSADVEGLLSRASHPKKFRNNFWKTSLERLFAINRFHETCKSSALLHVESDVILFPNFPWKRVRELDKLTWFSANENLDCAALLFTPNFENSEWLSRELQKSISLDPNLTDMQALYDIRKRNKNQIRLFPSSAPAIADQGLLVNDRRFLEITSMTNFFGGIFDALNMGMWLTGQNPRNLGGKVIRYEHFFVQDNRFTQQTFSNVAEYFFVGDSEKTEIFSLHVHSKNPKLLSQSWKKELTILIAESRSLDNKESFSSQAWVGSIHDTLVSVNYNPVKFLASFSVVRKFLRSLKKFLSVDLSKCRFRGSYD